MASEKDIQDVINTLIAEGIGEGEEGMRRIAETILNRAAQRGISPAEVVRQRAQYTGYSSPGPAAVAAQSNPQAISAAQAAWQLAQGPDDPTGGANHYWNPDIVNPSWADGMTQLGVYGNHAFASDRPVPPRAIPAAAPSPALLSPTSAAIRQMTSPSGGNTELQAALDQYATRERNRVVPAPAEDRVTARNRQFFGQDPFNGDPLTPATGAVVASIPTTRPTLPKMPVGVPQSFAGQDAAPGVAKNPTLQAALNARYPAQLPALLPPANAAPPAGSTQTVATYSTKPKVSGAISYAAQDKTPSPIGQPPTTIAVKSIPITRPPLPRPPPERVTTIATLSTKPQVSGSVSYAGQDTGPTNKPPSSMLASVPGPNGYTSTTKTEERLPPSTYAPGAEILLASLGVQSPQLAAAPIPFARPKQFAQAPKVAPMPFDRPTGVATTLSVKPTPPLPIPRPDLGMGGPTGRPEYVPTPMPAAMRPRPLGLPFIFSAAPKANNGAVYDPSTGTFLNPLSGGNGMTWNDGSGAPLDPRKESRR